MSRKDLVRTTASVAGVPLGEFRMFQGGEITSADVKSVRGAGGPELARGGRQTVGNVTITREDQGEVDFHWLASQRGRGRMTVARQSLDQDLNPTGPATVYTGVLMRVAPGEGDAQADNDLDEFELEMSCNSVVG